MNIFQIFIIPLIYVFSFISCAHDKEDDLDVTKCNYGKHHRDHLNWCDCKNVLGNGPHCEIKKKFNSTQFQVIVTIVPDHLDSWKKNLETQFPHEMITIVEETKYYVKGFVNNTIYFLLHFLPNISDKKYFLMPRSSVQMIEEIFSKDINVKTVSTKEEIRKGIETSKTNETNVNKNDYNRDHITWTLLSFILALMMLCFIKLYLEDIKKTLCCSTMNRSRKSKYLR